LIGEQHDRFAHHLNQLQLIKKLTAAGYQLAIGMEMFQQPYQQALDDYLTGKITESEFLTQSQYFDKWGYDYSLYKPIIDYALKQKLPLLALNIEADITRQVTKKGLYELEEKQRQQIPDALDFSDLSYREDLKSVFQLHKGMLHRQPMNFNYFLQSQVLWDESMAQAAHQFLQKHPQHILVILAGNGHLRYRYGIPQRLERLSGLSPLVVVQDDELGETIADYVLLTTPIKGQLTPVIGIYLDRKTIDKVIIDSVKDSSIAARARLKKGDIITQLDYKPLKSFADLKLALLYADTSKKVQIKLKRGDKILEKTLDFSLPAAKVHKHE
ncbi:MAG: ChaN family lipoprotein, partial [Thiotrichaceae bacterium]|nr:ChaN family lipoprotein [Thiotrichaceae bacterium]